MKKSKIFYSPLNLGANKCGIDYGYHSFMSKYPEYKNKIEFIELQRFNYCKEDFENQDMKFKYSVLKNLELVANKLNEEILSSSILPVLLGGDHSLAISSISAITNNEKKNIGVFWVDAHGDMNTVNTSPSGHIHGMPLASLLGYGENSLQNILYNGRKLNKENVVIFGVRSLDKKEKEFIDSLQIKYYTMENIRKMGFERSLEDAFNFINKRVEKIHISFDLDSIDPKYLTGVSTKEENGFTKKEGINILNFFIKKSKLFSLDIVEYNPLYEIEDNTSSYINDLLNLVK